MIVDEVKKSMMEAAKASGLSKQEMPSNVYVETLQWLPETGLVTDAFKIKRKVGLKNCVPKRVTRQSKLLEFFF